ncbi:MAG: hypothetical protein PHR30_08650 [Gallionellaceae bacterium]|nr:hypothetical protein [Gallionellaceae bacterium]
MRYNFEREIHLSEQSEYGNLYSWSLQEFDKAGNKIGSDQIPWQMNLYFTASELRYIRSIQLEQSYISAEAAKKNKSVADSETITAILRPGIYVDGQWLEDDIAFSMLGTSRVIRNFRLAIHVLENGDNHEGCSLLGCVSYTTEIDFLDETTDDIVVIDLTLSQIRFNSLAEIIKYQRTDVVQLRLQRASGFYSEWSPSISTDTVRILAADDAQKIVCPEGCNITPPRLGEVGECELTLIKKCDYGLFEKKDAST